MVSDSENWEQLQKLFHLSAEVLDDQLDSFLLSACQDPELRRRAKTLVLAERRSPVETTPPKSRMLTGKIGPYTLLRHIGSGGMGSVYLAERMAGGTIQRTALKMLSLHATSPFFTERFAREQHILASLNHPHITRLLDAGISEEGQPYLVMEYVDGTHLDAYCDHQSLDLNQRLKLFLDVCEAVSYAHRNLIVHLDLKPSNILVTEAEGHVKLLDFGTSKLLRPDGLQTKTVMATPAYASPEQLRNEAVTTACDVYALGAVLFELLSGRRPNQDSSVAMMIERSITEQAPEPLGDAVTVAAATHRGLTEARLRSELKGDLTTIVTKCLNPRPQNRYASVNSLIDDVQRYLDGRPILARPQTTTYRIRKFVRRNRKSVLAFTMVSVLLLATGTYALWRQQQAVREAHRALEMQSFMSELFKLANTSYLGKPAATIPEFLQLGVKVLPDLIKSPEDQRAAQLSLAQSMFQNADYVDAQPVFTQLIANSKNANDLPTEAEAEAYAGRIAYDLGQTEPGKALAAHALSLAHEKGVLAPARVMIEIFYAANQEDEGFRTEENLNLLQAAVKEAQSPEVSENERALATLTLAEALGPRGGVVEEDRLTQQALAIYNHEPYAICDQANAEEHLALVHNQMKDFQGSLALVRHAYDGFQKCYGVDSRNALEVQGYLAAAMLRAGQAKQVVPMLESSLPKWIKIVGPDSDALATPLLFLANAYLETQDYPEAETTAANLVRVEQGRINPLSAQMGVCQFAWAKALAGQHRDREALAHAELAERAFTAENSKSPGTRNNAAKNHALLLELRARTSS
jgi:serine/threonine protein kinase